MTQKRKQPFFDRIITKLFSIATLISFAIAFASNGFTVKAFLYCLVVPAILIGIVGLFNMIDKFFDKYYGEDS